MITKKTPALSTLIKQEAKIIGEDDWKVTRRGDIMIIRSGAGTTKDYTSRHDIEDWRKSAPTPGSFVGDHCWWRINAGIS
jgi:hypothetical protein